MRPGIVGSTRLLGLVVMLGLNACASIEGAPHATISTEVMRSTVNDFGYAKVIRAFYGTNKDREGLSRHDYRDMVVSVYLGAIDSEYYDFRQRLAASGRGSALGLDLAVLALSGLTGVVKESARREFATATTVVGGSRAAVDKNLFFDRTLPSVISAMDAERARVRTSIEAKLDLDSARYPLAAAFNDIAQYQLAGTLERGTQRVATVTADDAADAQRELEQAVEACETIEDLTDQNERLTSSLLNEDQRTLNGRRVAIAASTIEVQTKASTLGTYNAVIAKLNQEDCKLADRKAVVDRIVAAITNAEVQ